MEARDFRHVLFPRREEQARQVEVEQRSRNDVRDGERINAARRVYLLDPVAPHQRPYPQEHAKRDASQCDDRERRQ